MDHSSTSSEISFHGLPSKSKRPSIRKQIASSFSSQFSFSKHFFDRVFMNFYKIFAAHQRNILKISRKFTKKPPTAKSFFSKVAGFYKSSHRRCSVKQGLLRKVFANFTGKHLCQRLYFDKVAGLRL